MISACFYKKEKKMKKRKIVVLCVAFTMSYLIGCTPSSNSPEHIATSEQWHQSLDITEAEAENSEIQTYEPQSQSYSISISEIKGGWTVYPNPGNEEQLVLDNEDMSFSILMQSFPKQSDAYQDFASFESFYRDTTSASMGEGKVENIAIENDYCKWNYKMYCS